MAINERYMQFTVKDPQRNGTYITYQVTGECINPIEHLRGTKDATAEKFVAQKRYADFDCLREMLLDRWIGFFVPSIPPKQAIVSST